MIPADLHRDFSRYSPKNDAEGNEAGDGRQKADAERQRSPDVERDILGNALIRVVRGLAAQTHAIVGTVCEPAMDVTLRHPTAPSDLQPLIEVELIDR